MDDECDDPDETGDQPADGLEDLGDDHHTSQGSQLVSANLLDLVAQVCFPREPLRSDQRFRRKIRLQTGRLSQNQLNVP